MMVVLTSGAPHKTNQFFGSGSSATNIDNTQTTNVNIGGGGQLLAAAAEFAGRAAHGVGGKNY